MAINFSPQTYALVVNAKTVNEARINELYSSFENMTFIEKFKAISLIDTLKTLNFEYDKYIILYQDRNKNKDEKSAYVVIDGDTLPLISYKVYGDISRWQDIFNYNELVDTILETGTVLNIPGV